MTSFPLLPPRAARRGARPGRRGPRYRARHAARPVIRRRAGRPARSGGRGRQRPLVSALLVLLGVAVMVYPVAATQYNNAKQRDFAQSYQAQIAAAAPDQLAQEIAAAEAYNGRLTGIPILDPQLNKAARPPESDAYRSYVGLLASHGMMGRLRVPGIGVDLPVYHGTSDDVLAKGIGHLYGTALPVGGAGRHTVLTSHTGLPNATLLDRLVDLQVGDRFYIDVAGRTLAYEVDQIKAVLPSEISDLKPVAGADLATLFTCTPYAVNTHRLLVRGHRVPYDPAVVDVARAPGAVVGTALEPWMIWLLAGAAVSVGGFLLLIVLGRRRGRRLRRARRDAHHDAGPEADRSAAPPG